jgi:hypothetical protein
MKKPILCLTLLVLLPTASRANFMLGTSPNPLTMTAGTTSGTMDVTITESGSDTISAWQFELEIIPSGGATGTLTFKDPASGSPPPPTNYVFGGEGVGIAATNTGSTLSANDFWGGPGNGATVLDGGTVNLLAMDFLASSNASGTFNIVAVKGTGNTIWNDGTDTQQFFSNVPSGTGTVLIGNVIVTPSAPTVPEPGSWALMGLGGALLALAGWRRRRRSMAHCPARLGRSYSPADT